MQNKRCATCEHCTIAVDNAGEIPIITALCRVTSDRVLTDKPCELWLAGKPWKNARK